MNELEKRRGFSGSTLKLIAIVTMLVDHTAATILTRNLLAKGYYDVYNSGDMNAIMQFSMENRGLIMLIGVMRLIGRIAFPIFCFLLVEGFLHTRNVKKYAGRLAIFALISEIPFDLAISGSPFFIEYQNVMVTLLIGLLVLIGLDFVEKKNLNKVLNVVMHIVVIAVGMAVAKLLKTDYDWSGVLCISIFYLLRQKNVLRGFVAVLELAVVNLMEAAAFIDVLFIAKYNGQRGINLKYVFYAFYPVHLLILWFICYLLGTGSINTLV